MTTLTKRDLVVEISNKYGLSQGIVNQVLNASLDRIVEHLGTGGKVEFRNFGVFNVVTRKARVGRNPNKPEVSVVIPEHKAIKFKTGKEIKALLSKVATDQVSA